MNFDVNQPSNYLGQPKWVLYFGSRGRRRMRKRISGAATTTRLLSKPGLELSELLTYESDISAAQMGSCNESKNISQRHPEKEARETRMGNFLGDPG